MGELGALFNPGMRHEIEERKAQAARREEEGHGDKGHLRIDLLSGVAVINMGPKASTPTRTEPAVNDATDQHADPAEEGITATTAEAVDQADERDQERTEGEPADAAAAEDPEPQPSSASTGYSPEDPGNHVDVDADDPVDPAALDIARASSNNEPPV